MFACIFFFMYFVIIMIIIIKTKWCICRVGDFSVSLIFRMFHLVIKYIVENIKKIIVGRMKLMNEPERIIDQVCSVEYLFYLLDHLINNLIWHNHLWSRKKEVGEREKVNGYFGGFSRYALYSENHKTFGTFSAALRRQPSVCKCFFILFYIFSCIL